MSPRLIAAVDDEPLILDMYTEVLQDEGYRVATCHANADALACIQRELPDLVILDPWPATRVGGRTIYQALAEEPTTAGIPLILCTSMDPTTIQPPAAPHIAPVAILQKPFLIDDLLSAVETAFA